MTRLFEKFQLDNFLLEGLERMGIDTPTPVQMEAIPAGMRGRDIIGHSQTGTGKTLAFLLPILQQVDPTKKEIQAIILAPTRELTRQIRDVTEQLTEPRELDVVLIQGGVDINRQIQKLRRNPQLVVGTPGRVLELISQEKLLSHTAKFFVLDEADTMLEMGFKEDIEKILQRLKRDVQILLFAATFPPRVRELTKNFMKNPVHIQVNPTEQTVAAIDNVFFKVRNDAREKTLLELVRLYNPYLAIVFVRKKEQVDELVTSLRQAGFEVEGLYGDLQRGQRKQVMQRFRAARSQVLVATDIASRGLDIEGVSHIFNFDPPISLEQYIHRIGRTGRAGETGVAVNIITAAQEEKLRSLAEKLGSRFKEMTIEDGTIVEKKLSRKKKDDIPDSLNKRKATGATKKKYTGPIAKKKAIKEYQQKKKQELSKQVEGRAKGKSNQGPASRGRNKPAGQPGRQAVKRSGR